MIESAGRHRPSRAPHHGLGSAPAAPVGSRPCIMLGRLRSGAVGTLFVLLVAAGPSSAADAVPPKPIQGAPSPSRLSFIVSRQVEAEVSEVDSAARLLRLKTETGRLSLDTTGAPAVALKRGDFVVVDMVLIRHADPPRLARPHEEPPPLLTQRLGGSIAAMNRNLGIVTVTSPAGRLTLELPSAAMADLHTGNPVGIELAVRRPDASASPGSGASRPKKGLGALMLMLFGRTK